MNKIMKEDMIKRYVYDVSRRLPQKSRNDIEQELNSNIYDMLLDRTQDGDYTLEDVKAVLTELGSPKVLAASYKEEKRALISNEYYDNYCFVLKIVMGAVAIGMGISLAIGIIANSYIEVQNSVAEFFVNILFAFSQAFAYVTLVFFFVERFKVRIEIKKEWTVEDLPPIPDEKALIKKSDPIASIVFTVVVMLFFNFAPQFMGVFNITDAGVKSIAPVFDLDFLHVVLPLINICFLAGIAREILRVIAGKYTIKLSFAMVLINIVALSILLSIFLNPAIWNQNIVQQIGTAQQQGSPVDLSFLEFFRYFYIFFVVLLVFAYVLDSAKALYLGIRYGR